MARPSLFLATAGLIVAILAFSTKADALGPVDIEIGARAGVAAGHIGPLGFGIGGRGGVSVMGFYAGIDVIDYLGRDGRVRRLLADVGALLLPAGSDLALTAHGQIGVTF